MTQIPLKKLVSKFDCGLDLSPIDPLHTVCTVNLFIRRGERWKDPELRKYDLRESEWNRREELFVRLLLKYCTDGKVDVKMVLDLDHCFNLAFNIKPEVTDGCRKKLFKTVEDIKKSECSEENKHMNDRFRECIKTEMRKTVPKFDMYDHAKTEFDKNRRELYRWLQRKPLTCLRRVLQPYVHEIQEESRWPLWGSKISWTTLDDVIKS